MSVIHIQGQPLVRFVFSELPSWNQSIYLARSHWSKGHHEAKRLRSEGAQIAEKFMAECGPKEREFLIRHQAFVWVRVFRATKRTYDIHNVNAKAVLDGFTDARIWKSDSWPHVPDVLFSWQPPEARPEGYEAGNLFVVEVHELDAVIVNGVAQVLPSGRTA